MSDLIAKLTDKVVGWAESVVLMVPNLLGAIVVVIAFWVLARLVGNILARLLSRVSGYRALTDLACTTARLLVRITGIVVALHILDLERAATTFLAGAGIIGLALGFAFQDLTANFIAGVVMVVTRPLKVGDLVKTNDFVGTVQAIHLRSCRLRTLQGQIVMIPNRKIFEECLVNFNGLQHRRIDLEVGVSYGDDLEEVAQVILDAVASLDAVEEEPRVYFQRFGPSSIDLVVQFWVCFDNQPDYLGPQSRAIMAIKRAFDDRGITIPFPIRTLDFGISGGVPLSEQLPNSAAPQH